MLFSPEEVSAAINRDFEPAWEMVRPVPIIRIDFGNGHVVTRTLHGNVATHVCTPDGQLVDVLPGLYTPAVYAAALDQIRLRTFALPAGEADRLTSLRTYHQEHLRQLRASPPRIVYPRAAIAPLAAPRPAAAAAAAAAAAPLDATKRRLEIRTENIVVQPPAVDPARGDVFGPLPPAGRNLADWPLLAADTWRNESQRRLVIHERLADAGRIRPHGLTKWLYKEVLHTDLDDPYLGLGDALVGDDVFREEDA